MNLPDFALGPLDPPDHVQAFAATLLLDTLGVAAGAASLPAGRIARDHAVRFLGASEVRDKATLLFDGRQAAIPGAAFAAASQIDNLDAHDGLNLTKGHIGCALVPALCAFAEQRPDLSARDAMVALVAGYEIAARAGMALHQTAQDYHTSGAWNGLGVAALGCRLRGLGPDVLRQALGISEYHGPRSQMMREIANPTMLHDGSGMGALVGAMAVFLAEDGFTGAPAITVENAPDIWRDLGQKWTLPDNYIKPYPICRWAHAALDALGALVKDAQLSITDIEAVEVHTFAEAAELYPGMPQTTSQAQYSLRFALAALLVHGEIGPQEITGKALADRRVEAFLPRIHIVEDSRHSSRFPAARWSDVTLRLQSGDTLSSGDVHARGGPEAPMQLSEVEAKFQLFAADLAPARRADIWGWRQGLLRPDRLFVEFLALLHAAPGVRNG
ncbi:MAG: MmgE/PrpD family protein [Pseudomonadota bacterium]